MSSAMFSARVSRNESVRAGCALVPTLLLFCVAFVAQEISRFCEFRESFREAGTNATGYVEYVHLRTGMRFVLMGPGVLVRGARRPTNRPFCGDWLPPVVVGAFLLSKNECDVTVWNANVESRTEQILGVGSAPATNMTWYESSLFCRSMGLLLPSEIQWEYAYRCGEPSPDGGAAMQIWVSDAVPSRESRCGLAGMEDGVWEWCEDEWIGSVGDARVVRGHYGMYGYVTRVIEVCDYLDGYARMRCAVHPLNADKTIGFRPAADVPWIALIVGVYLRGALATGDLKGE
jgi:formylglycine-generating enzyme required for sulfatase activity